MAAENTPQEQLEVPNPRSGPTSKQKIVVIMGATGSGKSKLAIDLASHFPIEIINADSMQVYKGLDVLTNKVPLHERKGVPHHLLGIISPNVEFTAKDFRDYAIPLIDEICSRNCLPVIVGGTNYYIQALVSRFLLDDNAEDLEANWLSDIPERKRDEEEPDFQLEPPSENYYTYSRLKDLDPVAANRIHPNDQRKGILPSKLFQGDTMQQNWGRADNLRYDCCFMCVDASLPALDQYVDQRVDLMVSAGLLEEVRDVYEFDADYTRGLRQAIGVPEFEDFLRYWNTEIQQSTVCPEAFNDSNGEDRLKLMLGEAIEKVKLNTRRLVRRQKRRLGRLQMLFGWNIHFVEVTSCILCDSDHLWAVNVVEPSANIIKSFLDNDANFKATTSSKENKFAQRDLWTRYVCQHVAIRSLEVHMNGNNINRGVAIVNEYRV
ncbi:hypothetical protein OROHE_012223 [Orobanche hederae]